MLNIKYHGYYILIEKGVQRSRGVNELIRIVDSKQIEFDYVKSKLPEIVELIDLEVRVVYAKAMTILTIKCMYSFNHHSTWDTNINEEMVSNECPRCSKLE